jgi:general secretion pathway protein G
VTKIPLDPWDSEYKFASPGKHNSESFDVWSVGPDKQDGTDDDIGNWE